MDDPFIEIWLAHEPLEEASVRCEYRGRSNLSDELTRKIFAAFSGEKNNPIITLRDIRYNPGNNTLHLGVGECLFADHYVLNRTDTIPNGLEIGLKQYSCV